MQLFQIGELIKGVHEEFGRVTNYSQIPFKDESREDYPSATHYKVIWFSKNDLDLQKEWVTGEWEMIKLIEGTEDYGKAHQINKLIERYLNKKGLIYLTQRLKEIIDLQKK